MYAIIVDGLVEEFPITNLRRRFPQISFPDRISDDVLPENVIAVEQQFASYDSNTHKLGDWQLNMVDGSWLATQEIVPLSSEELQQIVSAAQTTVRANRDELLRQSDWTQLADAPVDKAAWAAYRQALRDIPSQPGFPTTIDWPQEP